MPKILKLEFDESITLDEILKELLYYHSRNQLVCCRYKGNYLSNKDISELKQEVDRLKKGLTKEEYKERLEASKNLTSALKIVTKYSKLEEDTAFKFQLGVVLLYTKEELKEKMLEHFINIYADENNKNSYANCLNYLANLVIILKGTSNDFERMEKIMAIINPIKYNVDELTRFDIAVKNYRNCIVEGELIDDILFSNVLKNKSEIIEKELKKLK